MKYIGIWGPLGITLLTDFIVIEPILRKIVETFIGIPLVRYKLGWREKEVELAPSLREGIKSQALFMTKIIPFYFVHVALVLAVFVFSIKLISEYFPDAY